VSPRVSASSSFAGHVRIAELFADRLVLDVDLERPGVVVAVDAWDPGWRASVDGRPARVLQANGVFRAVAVPAGRHTVRMLYRPRSVVLGAATSAGGLLVLAIVGGVAHRRRRRRH
jgi:MYXO-CTERM domain-containing protein